MRSDVEVIASRSNDSEQPNLICIDTATNTVIGAIPVGFGFQSITIAPDGTLAYVLGLGGSTIAVIDTTSNTVVDTITSFSCRANMAIAPLIPKTKDDCKNGGLFLFVPFCTKRLHLVDLLGQTFLRHCCKGSRS